MFCQRFPEVRRLRLSCGTERPGSTAPMRAWNHVQQSSALFSEIVARDRSTHHNPGLHMKYAPYPKNPPTTNMTGQIKNREISTAFSLYFFSATWSRAPHGSAPIWREVRFSFGCSSAVLHKLVTRQPTIPDPSRIFMHACCKDTLYVPLRGNTNVRTYEKRLPIRRRPTSNASEDVRPPPVGVPRAGFPTTASQRLHRRECSRVGHRVANGSFR